jgi:glycosyltransferase involved in cell wall biosynthesis
MSTTVSEALVLGVPVISTPCSGTDELFSVGNGKIIGDSDEEIANALCSEMDVSRMHSRGDSSQVEEFFDLDRAISAIEEILADDC